MSERKEGRKTVTVSEDYLAFLHDELAENQTRLRETLGDTAANAMFDWCADKLVRTTEKGKYAFHPIDAVVQRLSGWGMQVRVNQTRGTTQIEVQCPYAERIHRWLASSSPRCPLGEYFLGAIRLEDQKSQLVSNHLTPLGVKFVVQNR